MIAYFWGAEVTRVLLLSGFVSRRRRALREVWLTRRGSALAVGVLSPAAYILVLAALTQAPVIFVAPAREVSIVFGVLLGANLPAVARRRCDSLRDVG